MRTATSRAPYTQSGAMNSRACQGGKTDGGDREWAERAGPKVHDARWSRAAIHRARFRGSAARQPLSTYDGKGSACDAGRRLGGWLPLLRHRAALRAWTFRDPTERFPASEAARLLFDFHEGRPVARSV